MAIKTVLKVRTPADLETMTSEFKDVRDVPIDTDKLISANDQALHADSKDKEPTRHVSVFYRLQAP